MTFVCKGQNSLVTTKINLFWNIYPHKKPSFFLILQLHCFLPIQQENIELQNHVILIYLQLQIFSFFQLILYQCSLYIPSLLFYWLLWRNDCKTLTLWFILKWSSHLQEQHIPLTIQQHLPQLQIQHQFITIYFISKRHNSFFIL